MIGQQADATASRPYGANKVPGVIPANEYDMGLHGYAYYENSSSQVIERTSQSDGAYNQGWVGRNDAVDFNPTTGPTDPKSNGYNIGWSNAGEWLKYSVNAASSGTYRVYIRVACAGASTLSIRNKDGVPLLTKTVPSTGDWQLWSKVDMGTVTLDKGWNTLRLHFDTGNINVNYLEFQAEGTTAVADHVISYCNLAVNGNELTVNTDKDVDSITIYDASGRRVRQIHADRHADISTLVSGVYLVVVSSVGAGVQRLKLVKDRS